MALAPTGPGMLFQHQDSSPLTVSQFGAVFCRTLEGMGLYLCKFGLHSFRIGVATAAAQLGLPENTI